MNEFLAYVADANQLLQLALSRNCTPLNNEEYGALFDRYRTDAMFKQVVEKAADGHGLQIYATHPEHGLLLVNHQDGFYCPKLTDFNERIQSSTERLAFGVLFYVIAAFVYRTPESVAEDFGKEMPFRISQVVTFARQQLELARASIATDESNNKYVTACDYLLSIQEGAEDAHRRTLRGMIQHILEYYVDHGMFGKEEGLRQVAEGGAEGARPTVYRPRASYRVQARLMTNEGAESLINALRSEESN